MSVGDDWLNRSAALLPWQSHPRRTGLYRDPAAEAARSWLSIGQAGQASTASPATRAAVLGRPAEAPAARTRGHGIALPGWDPAEANAASPPAAATEPAAIEAFARAPAYAPAPSATPAPTILPYLEIGIEAAPAQQNAGIALQPGRPAATQPIAHSRQTTGNTPAATQTLNFRLKSPLQLSPSNSFTVAVPGAFYQHLSKDFSYSYAGFSADAHAGLYAGIKGSLKFNLGTILPDYPLALNPETVGYVQEGQVFTVSPTLISTSDAGFKLGLPTAALTGSFGLKGSAGVSLNFPSVSVGVSVFGHTIGYTFGPPPVSAGISFGSIESLPTSKTVNFTGGYVTVSELKPANYSTPGTTQAYGIPVISATAYTDPALAAQFDPIAVIANYVPDLKVLAGSKDFGIGSVNWDLLSLPISASLQLENRSTITELGLSAHLTESLNGTVTDLKTHAVTVGNNVGQQWTLTAPSLTPAHHGGVIDLKLAYQLTLQVQSTISLAGSFGLALDGPQGTVSLLGHDFGIGPIFSDTLFSASGTLLDLQSTTNLVTLTAMQNDLVFYGPIAMKQTLASSQQMSYALKAGGEQLVIQPGVYIEPASNTAGSYYGVIGTLGAAAIYNYGSVYANTDVERKSAGIQLLAGGKIVNTGNVNWDSGGGHLEGAPNYGIDIGGATSTVVNSGTIGNLHLAGIFGAAGSSNLSIYNTGVIRDSANDGIRSYGAGLLVRNQGTIFRNDKFGVNAGPGLLLFNSGATSGATQGYIESITGTAVNGGTNSYVRNDGLILGDAPTTSTVGVHLSSGFVVNTGTIEASRFGIYLGTPGSDSAYVYNSGLIATTGSGSAFRYAVRLGAQTNELGIKPGASFAGQARALSGSGEQNTIHLLAGSSAGTLNMANATNYVGFDKIALDPSAAWLLETTTSNPFGGATITGLAAQDRIGFAGLAFAYGDKALLDTATGQLTLEAANGSTLATVQLAGPAAAANLHVSGNANATYIREFTGNFTNVLRGTVAAQQIGANSYYGGNLTVAAGASVSNSVAGAPASSFGLLLAPVLNVATTTSNGKPATSTITTPVTFTNQGSIAGSAQGVYLQSAGLIENGQSGSIYARTGDGIFQNATLTGALIHNDGSIVGAHSAINVGIGATVSNDAALAGGTAGILSGAGSLIRNAGTIVGLGAQFTGVSLSANSTLVNGAAGLISGRAYGVHSTAAGALVMNSGAIDGTIGIDLAAGGFLSNSYTTSPTGAGGPPGSTTRLGTIIATGGAYAVKISGGAGTVANEANALTSAPGLGLIGGIALYDGGTVLNGRFGEILAAAGKYAANLAPTGMKAGAIGSIANSGTIGAVRIAGGDSVDNAGGASLLSVSAVPLAGNSGAVTILNQGTIGSTSGTVTAISAKVAAVINNGFGATIEGSHASAIDLLGGGTITDSGAIDATGAATAIDFGTAAGTLLLQAGASFKGNVKGNAAASLILGPGQASIAGIGVQITGFGHNMVDAGSLWVLRGQNILAGSWTVAGELFSGDPLTGQTYGLTASGNVIVSGALQGANAFTRMGEPGQDGANGVAIATGGTVKNSGLIRGGWGGNGGYGGSGVVIEGGTLVNTAQVTGGSFYYESHSGPGGVGVALGTGSLVNGGTIRGGTSTNPDSRYGLGGTGVGLGAGGVAINTGVIVGGNGAFYGGVGVLEDGGTLTNTGMIGGGSGAHGGGAAGVWLLGGTLIDAGVIAGGGGQVAVNFGTGTATLALRAGATFIGSVTANAAGHDTLELSGAAGATLTGLGSAFAGFPQIIEDAGSHWTLTGANTIAAGTTLTSTALSASAGTLLNDGMIAAQTAATSPTVSGDAGLILQSGALSNNGSIRGGTGQSSQSQPSGTGGAGVVASGGTLTNAGTITGGGGPAVVTCGAGVSLSGSANIVNSGTILGGGDQRYSFYGGAGLVQTGGTSVNRGAIAGGAGYNGDGVGVSLSAGTLTNFGHIAGGSFGNDASTGAVGASIGGGELVNAGTIVGGAGYNGVSAGAYVGGGNLIDLGTIAGGSFNGTHADAVTFGSAAATLTILPQSVFVGRVMANSAVQDELLLAARGGTLSGLGSEFLNFSLLDASNNTTWTLAGTQSFSGTLIGGGAITLAGTLNGAGRLTIAAGTTLAATGTFGQAVDVLGAIAVQGGTVTAHGALGGTGTLTTVAGSRLTLAGGGGFAGALSGAGTIAVTAGLTLAKGASLSAATLLETANLTLGAGENLSNAAGKVFDLAPAASTAVSLSGAAGDIFTNAGHLLATGAGIGTIGLAFINSGTLVSSTGTLVLASTVNNTGTIEAASGLLSARQAIGGTGMLAIGSGGTLSLGNSVAAGQTVDFLAHAGVLELADPLGFKAAIAGFAGTATIDLAGVAATSLHFANGTLTVDKGTNAVASLHFTGAYTSTSFTLVSDGHGGSLIRFV